MNTKPRPTRGLKSDGRDRLKPDATLLFLAKLDTGFPGWPTVKLDRGRLGGRFCGMAMEGKVAVVRSVECAGLGDQKRGEGVIIYQFFVMILSLIN